MNNSELLTYVVNEEYFPNNAVIYQEGKDFGKWAYVILEGRVKIKKKTAKGLLTINTLKKGSIVGELVLWQLEKNGRTTSAFADGPVTLGLLDTAQINYELCKVSPILQKFLHTLATRVKATTNNVTKKV